MPRTGCDRRGPRPQELDDCFAYLSRELTITTPHYVLAVGEETSHYLLGKLFKSLPYATGDSLELRVFDNPGLQDRPGGDAGGAPRA